jgi:hypothetical protein
MATSFRFRWRAHWDTDEDTVYFFWREAVGSCSHGVVLYGTTRGAEAFRFGIEAAGVDDAVAIVAARWVHYEVLSAVV